MEIVSVKFEGEFNRAHHCTQFVKDINKIIVCGGMLVPEGEGSKVTEWFSLNVFSIFKIDEALKLKLSLSISVSQKTQI